MLTFAGRPKSLVFGSHRTDTGKASPAQGDGGGGTSSRLKRMSWMMHSSRPSQSPDSDVLSMSLAPPPKDITFDTNDLPSHEKIGPILDTNAISNPNSKPQQQMASIPSQSPSSVEGASPMDGRKFSISFPNELPKPDHSSSTQTPTDALSESSFGRKSSISSISFRRSRNPSVAPSLHKQSAHGMRIRAASPPPQR
ncbi:hypothetical protein QQS21_009744 [Conoideocrella luteorostrata]|uniref:Uncharacterized protein n=1 Tax=Conoideocrella luteorostrata TaxID=1105319 RepID=A0AAJ0CJ33_9HYPO|nr:hypothetical protein QQS21_009744 [Conoideocrella luteorostrata]